MYRASGLGGEERDDMDGSIEAHGGGSDGSGIFGGLHWWVGT